MVKVFLGSPPSLFPIFLCGIAVDQQKNRYLRMREHCTSYCQGDVNEIAPSEAVRGAFPLPGAAWALGLPGGSASRPPLLPHNRGSFPRDFPPFNYGHP